MVADMDRTMLTAHHLNFSRSSRVRWRLQELYVGYRLIGHGRLAGFMARHSLKREYALGKFPAVEDEAQILTESAVILEYLNDRGAKSMFGPVADTIERRAQDQWLHWVEGSVAPHVTFALYRRLGGGVTDDRSGHHPRTHNDVRIFFDCCRSRPVYHARRNVRRRYPDCLHYRSRR